MKMIYCPFCGTRLGGDLPSCRACGEDLSRFTKTPSPHDFKGQMEAVMRDFIAGNEDLIKEIADKIELGEPMGKGMFFSVEMHGDKPTVRSGNIEDIEEVMKDVPLPPFVRDMIKRRVPLAEEKGLEFRELKYEAIDRPGGRDIVVHVPGVESEGRIEVNRTGSRLEVTARGRDTIYFTEIPMEEGLVVRGQALAQGILRIELGYQ